MKFLKKNREILAYILVAAGAAAGVVLFINLLGDVFAQLIK